MRWTVRGHEKVPASGQVEVLAGGQLKVPIPRSPCRPGLQGLGGDGGGVSQSLSPPRELLLKSARERMDIISAYRDEGNHRGRRPAVWSPGEYLVIDWGAEGGLHVFCAVLAWCRVRFVRFAADERAATTLAMLAECLEVLGGVPGKVLADRMGCLKGGVVANVVVPAAEYVRFAGHYGFRPGFCEAADPESKGIVENLVGYAKGDLLVPQAPFGDLAAANDAARAWCAEVNGVTHSEICAVPAERLVIERELLAPLPSLRASIGRLVTRKVDRLSCVRSRLGPLLGADPTDRAARRPTHRRRPAARDPGRHRCQRRR